mmetsp:Transcript_26988/g.58979  ORF Transcript_26988/g.58979 Transcript_26988/m.58979 type:complete len:105 (-) Transcript_26988:278-592(-)
MASVDANKIRAIENAIDQNDWKEVSELASELNNAASPDVDMEKMKEEYSPVAAAMAEAGKWQAIAEANEPKSNEASEAASWAGAWRIRLMIQNERKAAKSNRWR